MWSCMDLYGFVGCMELWLCGCDPQLIDAIKVVEFQWFSADWNLNPSDSS